ncbi:MAG: glycosyltransferase family 2 protein [Oscillospiraceae bacterium]|nr:glycosyltransferase family 2 protein [Oscillospiraceae bacterium]
MISIIVPVYNLHDYLQNCLQSIGNQTYKDFEVIVIDDGSTDDSLSIACDYSEHDSRFKVIHTDNFGVSHARNTGIRASKGKYITFIDGDDWIGEDYLHTLHERICKDNVDIVACSYFRSKDVSTLVPITEKDRIIDRMTALNSIADPKWPWFSWPWGKLYLASLLKENSIFFDEEISVCEDSLFNSNVVMKANSILLLSKPLYYYRIQEKSATHQANTNPEKIHSKIQAFKKISLISNMFPGSQFQNRINRVLFGAFLQYEIVSLKNNTLDTHVIDEFTDIRRKLRIRDIGIKNYCKWLLLKHKPAILRAIYCKGK